MFCGPPPTVTSFRSAFRVASRGLVERTWIVLRGADLGLADLLGADLRGADLRSANLADAIFLTQSQVRAAVRDAGTTLPSVLL